MAIQAAQTLISKSQRGEAQPNRFLCSTLDKFFTLTLDMFFIAGFDGYFKQLNPMCEKILGFTSDELLRQQWIEFIHPEDQQSTLDQLGNLTTATGTIQFENRFRCKNGAYKWLQWSVSPCPEQELIYAVVRDNTEYQQAQEAREESEERFRLLVEGVNDYAIIMLDPLGRVVSWNTGAQRIHQYRASEIINRHVSCFYTEKDIHLGKPEQGLQIAARQGCFEEEGLRVRQDGSKFWANVVITALKTQDGQLRGFARVTRDITERKMAQEALQRAHDDLEKRVEERTAELTKTNELLKQEIAEREKTEAALRQSKARLKQQAQQLQAEKQNVTSLLEELKQTQAQLIHHEKMSSLGRLVAGIAHEINNPVGFIYGNLDYATCYIKELMQLVELYSIHYPQPVPPIQSQLEAMDFNFLMADMPKLLSSMKVGATRLRQILLSLQNFLRAEQTEMKPVDIHEGIDSTLLILQHRLKGTDEHLPITVIKDYGHLPLVECYAGQLNQVFMNVLNNAIDVLEQQTGDRETSRCITISTEVSEINTEQLKADDADKNPHAIIRIADNGSGISEEVRNKMFEPFFTTKSVGKGTGLGLSISYQIVVEKHGGQLTCVSKPGKGTEFAIAIPVRQTH